MIVLFLRNTNLKMNVIRILMKKNLYYIEASNTEELFFKLDMSQNAGLLILDYKEDEELFDMMEVLCRAGLQQLPVLWITPSEKSNQLPDAAKRYITDILLFPFKESTLLRKIDGIMHIKEDKVTSGKKDSNAFRLSPDHSSQVITAMELAARGGYPLCIIRLQVMNAFMELNLKLLNELKHTLRKTDQVLETDLGEFIVLCPYTPLQGLNVVETKIKETVDSIIQDSSRTHKVQINGTNFPECVKKYDDLVSELAIKISYK
ncbi:MAG TPA: hypothetical protein GX505_02500 [Clostridiales bacterium]|nr:hypothetical protein [Clostridiales bacterium]